MVLWQMNLQPPPDSGDGSAGVSISIGIGHVIVFLVGHLAAFWR